MRKFIVGLAALAAFGVTPAYAIPCDTMEHIHRHGNVIKISDAKSNSFYYQTKVTYTRGVERITIRSDYNLVNDSSVNLKIKNPSGKWYLRIRVLRGYGDSRVVVWRDHFTQE